MIFLKPMTGTAFNEFKKSSQQEYATNLALVEQIPLEEGLKSASEQFSRMIGSGLEFKTV